MGGRLDERTRRWWMLAGKVSSTTNLVAAAAQDIQGTTSPRTHLDRRNAAKLHSSTDSWHEEPVSRQLSDLTSPAKVTNASALDAFIAPRSLTSASSSGLQLYLKLSSAIQLSAGQVWSFRSSRPTPARTDSAQNGQRGPRQISGRRATSDIYVYI